MIVSAGSDTVGTLDVSPHLWLTHATQTVSSMVSLFLALTQYPEVQRRAQRELDSVLGRDRLPTFEDRPRLPYLDALCKEVLRWRMVVPLGTRRLFMFDANP
jgi:cytochrome P450